MARASKAKGSGLAAKVGIGALGAAVGGVLALLFAPRSGKQTRTKLAQEGRKVTKAATKAVVKLEQQAGIVAAPAARAATKKAAATKAKKK